MRIQVLQHVAFEGPAAITEWAAARGHDLRVTPLFAGAPLPAAADCDLLVIMGGPMGVRDEAAFDWMAQEKALIRAVIDLGKRVLGVCLGAQLIADVLGAAVTRNAHKEIGWFEIQRLAAADRSPFGRVLPERIAAFHWHGDTFAIPEGAVPLFRSAACENQAFAIGQRVLALQFHLESTPESVRLLVENGQSDLVPGPYIQAEQELLRADAPFEELHRLLGCLLDGLAATDRPG